MKLAYILTFSVTLCIVVIMTRDHVFAQKEIIIEDDPMFEYSPGQWRNGSAPLACDGGHWPRYGVFCEVTLGFTYPTLGYPDRSCLVAGLNDTAQVFINWINSTKKDYSFVGKHPETWFAPRVYRTTDLLSMSVPWRDSTNLSYRIRGWVRGLRVPMPAQDTLPARMEGGWSMVMDVWNLPEGEYSLCIDTTTDVPGDFNGFPPGGDNYQYYPPRDLADTINAYEACFERTMIDGNFPAAKSWLDSMLHVNSKSVPGWWLKATYHSYVHDTTQTKAAYDSALHYWSTGADPAMPDTTNLVTRNSGLPYTKWCGQRMTWERSFYGP